MTRRAVRILRYNAGMLDGHRGHPSQRRQEHHRRDDNFDRSKGRPCYFAEPSQIRFQDHERRAILISGATTDHYYESISPTENNPKKRDPPANIPAKYLEHKGESSDS